jgi:Ca2+-binding RTX toxin-like protein
LSEIEFQVNVGGNGSLYLFGTTAPNTIAIGSNGIAVNNDSDADITLLSGSDIYLLVDGGPNADVLTGQGGFGSGSPTTNDLLILGVKSPGPDTGDTISGGNGNDQLFGMDGDDVINGYGGRDQIEGWSGNDMLSGGDGDDLFAEGGLFGIGADVISGGVGVDEASYLDPEFSNDAPVFVSLDGVANDGEAGEGDNVGVDVENVRGGTRGDTLIGSAGANVLTGDLGNDTIEGLAGDDSLYGGEGNDTITGGDGSDLMDGSFGDDTFYARDGVKDFLWGRKGFDSAQIDRRRLDSKHGINNILP